MKIDVLEPLDRLAQWWITTRQAWAIKHCPELSELKVHQLNLDKKELSIMVEHPGVVLLAEDAAAVLDAHHAKNYIEFDMMPRLTRKMRPVRVTVQWAVGVSPARRAALLALALKQYAPDHPLLRENQPTYNNGETSPT